MCTYPIHHYLTDQKDVPIQYCSKTFSARHLIKSIMHFTPFSIPESRNQDRLDSISNNKDRRCDQSLRYKLHHTNWKNAARSEMIPTEARYDDIIIGAAEFYRQFLTALGW